jgi:hypothetical protein
LVVAAIILVSFVLSAPTADAQTRPEASQGTARDLQIRFDEQLRTSDGTFTNPLNSGSAELSVEVQAIDGGELVRRDRASAGNGAARTPRHDAAADAPRAVVDVVDQTGPDNLDPARRGFTFGAYFKLDATSEEAQPGSSDNGDNLVQRGLYNAAAQYKLQVDHHQVLCRIKGRAGAVAASTAVPIHSGVWYRARCTRSHHTVTVSVTSRNANGDRTHTRTTATGPTGVVSPEVRSVPLSIGGKLSPDGSITGSTDQFNGHIDNVVVRIG